MKIGVTTFGCDSGRSGIGQYAINLLREFAATQSDEIFEVFVYVNEKHLFVPNTPRMSALYISENFRPPILNILWHQFSLPRWCRKRGFDVLFLPAGNRRLPLRAPCPTVGTVHDFSSIHVKEKYDRARMFYIMHVLPILIRQLTRVISPSESTKRDILEIARVPEEQVTVIPQAVDHRVYYPRDKVNALAHVGPKYGVRAPYILCAARIEHPGKNHVRLIRAFAHLKATEHIPHQLVIAGSDWTRAAVVHRVAEKTPCKEDILFTGFFPFSDMPDLYCGADLFVYPSLYEGFGLCILEAMACGIPVACSNISSMPEVAGDAAIFFDPYDEEDLAEAMRRLLTDSALRNTYVQKGLERSKLFTWSHTAKRTLELLRAVAEER